MASAREEEELQEQIDLPASLPGQASESKMELSDEERRFQEERRTMLGGTDQAAHLGFSTYRNAWDVAAEKRAIIEPWGGNERTELGQLLEEPIAREYARRTGQRIARVREAVRLPDVPFLGGHVDRRIIGKRKGLEVKTVEFGKEKWSAPGEPLRVPREYYVQVQHYMLVTGWEEFDIAAMFGLSRIRWYTIQRNELVIRALRERGEEFWAKYVVGPDLPPIQGKRAEGWVRERFPEPSGPTIVIANAEQAEAIAHWQEAKRNREIWEEDEEKFKLHVQAAIGEATGIVSDDVVVTWTKNKDSTATATDWEGLLAHVLDKHSLAVSAEEIQQFTRTLLVKKGPRVMRVKRKEA